MNQLSWITTVLSVLLLINPVLTDHGDCYCLKTELSGLKNSMQIEAVRINGENVYLIAEQTGTIHKYNPANANMKLTPYINVTHLVDVDPNQYDEGGLLGFALHPNFATNQMLYMYSTRVINNDTYAVVSEIQGTAVNGEKMLVLIKQDGNDRKGGRMLFGLDDYLYVFVGDSLNRTQTDESKAQDGAELLGKVLRLDVDKLTVADFKLQYYDIPSDNPNKSGWRPEVYAMGFRNPWRCSIDKADSRGRIFCADHGLYVDEISLIQSGGNYGFPIKEGTSCLSDNQTLCDNIADEVLPIESFNLTAGASHVRTLVLGQMYRGSEFASMQGQLMFGDFNGGNLFSLAETVNPADNSSTWDIHNITECSASQCGCGYKSQRLTYLYNFGNSWENEMMMLMSNSRNPGTMGTVLYSLSKGGGSTPTCGASGVTFNTLLGLVLLSVSVLNYLKKDN